MDMFEEAQALAGTMKMRNKSQSDMAKILGVSQSYIANKLRLLAFDEGARGLITKSGLTERHARAILRIRDDDKRLSVLRTVIDRGLTVAKTEALVDLFYEPLSSCVYDGASSLSKAESFKKSLAESVRQLRGCGVSASLSQSYHGTKLYITVTLDEATV